jgi:hypothetical protein
MTVCAAILSAMVASCDGNYKLSRGGLGGSVKEGFQLPLHVECGLLRRLG